MTGRIRKFGLVAVLVGGTLLFGVGFAGAQSSDGAPAPKATHSDSSSTSPTQYDGSGCGDKGEAAVTSIDL